MRILELDCTCMNLFMMKGEKVKIEKVKQEMSSSSWYRSSSRLSTPTCWSNFFGFLQVVLPELRGCTELGLGLSPKLRCQLNLFVAQSKLPSWACNGKLSLILLKKANEWTIKTVSFRKLRPSCLSRSHS